MVFNGPSQLFSDSNVNPMVSLSDSICICCIQPTSPIILSMIFQCSLLKLDLIHCLAFAGCLVPQADDCISPYWFFTSHCTFIVVFVDKDGGRFG